MDVSINVPWLGSSCFGVPAVGGWIERSDVTPRATLNTKGDSARSMMHANEVNPGKSDYLSLIRIQIYSRL